MRTSMQGFQRIFKAVCKVGLLRPCLWARNDNKGTSLRRSKATEAIQFWLMGSLCFLCPFVARADFARPWQLYYQEPATPVMEHLYDFHRTLLIIEGLIVLLVAGLLIFACI